MSICFSQEIFHVQQVRAVGAEIVFKRLFITDINKNTLKNWYQTVWGTWNVQAALRHILQ